MNIVLPSPESPYQFSPLKEQISLTHSLGREERKRIWHVVFGDSDPYSLSDQEVFRYVQSNRVSAKLLERVIILAAEVGSRELIKAVQDHADVTFYSEICEDPTQRELLKGVIHRIWKIESRTIENRTQLLENLLALGLIGEENSYFLLMSLIYAKHVEPLACFSLVEKILSNFGLSEI